MADEGPVLRGVIIPERRLENAAVLLLGGDAMLGGPFFEVLHESGWQISDQKLSHASNASTGPFRVNPRAVTQRPTGTVRFLANIGGEVPPRGR